MPDLASRTLKRRYRIDALLGRGGMAEVYRAFDTRRHYPVAVKVLREDLAEDWDFVRRFQAEADSLGQLAHQNIVRFYSFEQDGRIAFIVMDYVEGDTLRSRLFEAQGRPMAPAEALPILRQIAAALEYAHAEGIIHRDVKPANIMLRPDGTVLLADFGIAKAVDAATMTTAMPGTPAYMSPEQCRGDRLDARSDVYSLGVVLYEILAGRRPFAGQTAPDTVTGGTAERVRWEQIHGTPPNPRRFNPALTEGITQVILRALAKDPATRYPSAMAFAQAFEAASTRSTPRTPPSEVRRPVPVEIIRTPPPPPPPPNRSIWRIALAALGLLAIAACLVAGVFLLSGAGLGRRILLAVGTEPTTTTTALGTPTPRSTPVPAALLIVTPPPPPPATPMASITPTATDSTTPTTTPTASSSPTPTRLPTPFVAIERDTVNIRSGPGTVYPIVDAAQRGMDFAVISRDPNGEWLRLTGDQERWIAAGLVASNVPIGGLPVSAVIPPTPTPSPIPKQDFVGSIGYLCNDNVCILDMATMTTVRVPSGKMYADAYQPSQSMMWSPDGRMLAFVASPPSAGVFTDIYLVNEDGTGLRDLVDFPFYDSSPSWSPDSQTLAFLSDHEANRPDNPRDLFTLRIDGSNLQRLTVNSSYDWKTQTSWSPDGRWIAFWAIFYQRDDDYRLYLIRPDGAGLTPVTSPGGPKNKSGLSWSPDSRQIAFVGYVGDSAAVCLANTDGGGAPCIELGFTHIQCPAAWSPTGQHIAFGGTSGQNPMIFVVDKNTLQAELLTDNGNCPSWSPDGQYLAFERDRSIWVARKDGSMPMQLTHTGQNRLPLWSPTP